MIRLRCETGIRSREEVKWKAPIGVWLPVAQSCAQFQAHSVLATGRRRVDLSRVQELHRELDLLMLYEAGILELVAWEEHNRTGALTRIKCADLSVEAAHALTNANLVPEAILNSLLAPDLSQQRAAPDELNSHERQRLAQWSGYDISSEPAPAFTFDRNMPGRYVPHSSMGFVSQHSDSRSILS